MAETQQKVYPHKEEDISYEKEIVDAIKKLPLEQRLQAVALNNYCLIKKQIEDNMDAEIDKIIEKYNKIHLPLMEKCNQIIAGERAPVEEEVQESKEYLTAEEKEKINEHLTAAPIDDYWFKVLTSCSRLSQDIFEADHPLLKKIQKIENKSEEGTDNFEIIFYFYPNEFFENDVLKVKFFMIDENEPERSEGTEIKWKEGKDITKKTIQKKQKNKKTGKTRTVTKTVDAESFFNFFKTIKVDDEAGDGEEEGEEEELLERLNINFDIAATLQEEILSYHLEYFLGLRTGDEGMEGMPGIDEGDEDDEDDDEDDDDKGHKAKPKAKPVGGEAKPGEKPECKQQ